MRIRQVSTQGPLLEDGQPAALEGGTGWVIGDDVTITAGHVGYEYDRNRTHPQIVHGSNNIRIDDRGYEPAYGQQVANLLAAGTMDTTPNGRIEANLIYNDRVSIRQGGNVDSSDAGLAVFLDMNDMVNFGGLLSGSVITRYGNRTGTQVGSVSSASGGIFRFTVPADVGDSGGAYIITSPTLDGATARGFVLGVQSSQA